MMSSETSVQPAAAKGCPFSGTYGTAAFDPRDGTTADAPHLSVVQRERRITRYEDHGGYWVAARYDDVRRATLDSETYRVGTVSETPRTIDDVSMRDVVAAVSPRLRQVPAQVDPPEHARYRRALAPFLSAAAARDAEPRMRHWTTVAIDDVVETGRIDLVADLTKPVAFLYFTEWLGIPADQWPVFAGPISRTLTSPSGTDEQLRGIREDDANFDVLQALAAERRVEPRDDVLSQFGALRDGDGELFSDEEIAAFARQLLIGAAETTGALVTQSLVYLAEHPDARRRLADDPSLIPTAIEEFLRFFTPGKGLSRTVNGTVAVGDMTLQHGDQIILHLFPANRDPEVFDDPEQLILDRSPNRHLAFGSGIHKCSGLHLARLEARILLEEVLRRLPDYRVELDDAVPISASAGFAGYRSLPAVFTPGARVQADRRPA